MTPAKSNRFSNFPSGWFRLAYSDELKPGEVKPVRAFGQDLVMFRTDSGKAAVLDAFCPHLGAHLGHGGMVKGECIECPFHAWQFDTSGECASIPYAKRKPARANNKAWHVREHSGLVMVWHHLDNIAPDWEVPEFEEYSDDGYMPYRSFTYEIETHIQDVVENSVDNRHLTHVHGLVEANPIILDSQNNPFKVNIDSKIQMTKKAGSSVMNGLIEISNFGVGISPARVKIGPIQYLFLATVTPIEHGLVDARFAIAFKKFGDEKTSAKILDRIFEDEYEQVGRDIPIWNNKVFVDPPLLSENDSAIGPLRRWARQFYKDPAGEEAAE